MVRRIVWSKDAVNSKREILTYWIDRNKSNSYSKKLNSLISNAIAIIQKFPNSGKATDIENIRVKAVKNYLIIYEITENSIVILIIWDMRRDPNSLIEYLKKNKEP